MAVKKKCTCACLKRRYKKISRNNVYETALDTEDMEEYYESYLITELLDYADGLCDEIVSLRKEFNKLDRELNIIKNIDLTGYQEPYIDLVSDIYKSFFGIYGYDKFREEFEGTNFA